MHRYLRLPFSATAIVYISIVAIFGFVPSLCGAASDTATHAEASFPPFVPRARWSEDWSMLRDVEFSYEDSWFPFKHIPLDRSGENYISFGGEYRFVYELYDPADRSLSDIGRQDVVLNRFALHANWHLNKRWRFFGQLGYALSGDREGGAKVGDESRLNVWQLFVDHRHTIREGERLDLRVGRQFIEKANWFIGSGEARNVRHEYP